MPLGQGDGVFHAGQEGVEGFFVQRKGHGIKHLSCSFLKPGSHLPITALFSGPAVGLSFVVQQKNSIYSLEITQPATSQPKL